jgi:hypothetical protein
MSDIRIGDRVRIRAGMHAGAVGVIVEAHPSAPHPYAVIDSAGERIAAFVGVLELVTERDIPRTERDRLIDCGQDAALGCAEAPGCLRCFGNEVAKAQRERDELKRRVSELEMLTDAPAVAAEMDRLLGRILNVQGDTMRAIEERDAMRERAVTAEGERDRLRRELEKWRADHATAPEYHTIELGEVTWRIDVILRGES